MKFYQLLFLISVLIGFGVWFLISYDKPRVTEPITHSVTDIVKKSKIEEPWRYQSHWIDTSTEKLYIPDGAQENIAPVAIGSIRSKENVFVCDFTDSYDPLNRHVIFVWKVDYEVVLDNDGKPFSGRVLEVELNPEDDHTISLSIIATIKNDAGELEYQVAGGFHEAIALRDAMSKESSLDFYAK